MPVLWERIKARQVPSYKKDLRGLAALAEELPLKRRIVVCSTQKPYREDDGTEMLPVEDFLRALRRGDILQVNPAVDVNG